MLIVSRVLLARTHEHGAWQPQEEAKRGPEDYVLVKGADLKKVAESVVDTARQLDLDKHLNMRHLLPVLASWAKVSPEEELVWNRKRSSNAPIFEPELWAVRKKENRRAEVRIYDNTVDLVLALVGYIRARGNELEERILAGKVLKSDRIQMLVGLACDKTIEYIKSNHIKPDNRDEIVQREYRSLHNLTWSKWSSGFGVSGFRVWPTAINIMVLHDVYTWFDEAQDWKGPWGKDAVGGEFKKRLFKNKSTMRHNVGTLNEDSDWTARARWKDLPTWAGPSGTVHGLCWMLRELVKVRDEELLACAYALFAVWASDVYPKTATPIHHLFGVMAGVIDYLPEGYKDAWQAESIYTYLKAFLKLRSKL